MKTKIYGASDDLVEIDGAISEEVNPTYGSVINILGSDGTKATIHYSNSGFWKIEILLAGAEFDKIIKGTGDNMEHTDEDAIGCSSYSDVLIFKEGIKWVKIGKKKFNKEEE